MTADKLRMWLDYYLWHLGRAMRANDPVAIGLWARRVAKVRAMQGFKS